MCSRRTAALTLAALQGYGLVVALESMRMTNSTVEGFVPVTVATFIGSTAILIWIARQLARAGLDGFCLWC